MGFSYHISQMLAQLTVSDFDLSTQATVLIKQVTEAFLSATNASINLTGRKSSRGRGEVFHWEEATGTPVVQVAQQCCSHSQPSALLCCWAFRPLPDKYTNETQIWSALFLICCTSCLEHSTAITATTH